MEWNDSMVDWLNEWMHDCMNEWLNEWMMIYCNDRNWGMMGIKNLNRSVETHLTISISTIDVFHQGLSNLYSWHTFDAQRLWVVSGMVFPEVCVQEWKDDSRWLYSAPIHFRWWDHPNLTFRLIFLSSSVLQPATRRGSGGEIGRYLGSENFSDLALQKPSLDVFGNQTCLAGKTEFHGERNMF